MLFKKPGLSPLALLARLGVLNLLEFFDEPEDFRLSVNDTNYAT